MRLYPVESVPQRASVKVYLLSIPRIQRGDEFQTITIEKAAILLVYLALSGARPTREHLQTLLWPDSDAQAGRKNLRNLLWHINARYGKDLLVTDQYYVSLSSAVWTDVGDFECISLNKDATITQIRELLFGLHSVSLLPGFRSRELQQFELWLTLQRERLGRLHDNLITRLIEHYRHMEDWQQVIEVAFRAIAADRRQESTYFHLIDAYRQLGERAKALHTFEQMRMWLASEYGLQPSDEMRQLQRAILTDNLTRAAHRFRAQDEIISLNFSSNTYLQELIEDAAKDAPEDTSA
ncbi:MAG: BTAD domain-containing putative transcriptional regulator [Chloroflexota bacterium]|nr:BTAD domain-containing putative transcriptional regulator [Chloroflexota bacterium]